MLGKKQGTAGPVCVCRLSGNILVLILTFICRFVDIVTYGPFYPMMRSVLPRLPKNVLFAAQFDGDLTFISSVNDIFEFPMSDNVCSAIGLYVIFCCVVLTERYVRFL